MSINDMKLQMSETTSFHLVSSRSNLPGTHAIQHITTTTQAYNCHNKATPPRVAPKPQRPHNSHHHHQQHHNNHQATSSKEQVTPDEIIRVTRSITSATVRAVAAGHSGQQNDVIAAANMGRKAVNDLLKACEEGASGLDDASSKERLFTAGRSCALAFQKLLSMINQVL